MESSLINIKFTVIKSSKIKVIMGIFISFFTSMSVVLSSIIFPDNKLFSILGVAVIPFITSFIFTKSIVDALTIVCINEIFFGVAGDWVEIGPLRGRGILLIIVLAAYVTFRNIKIDINGIIKKRTFYVLFYGLVLPFFLFSYSVIIRETDIIKAFSDVMRFSAILIYFPVRDLVKRNQDILLGWIVGASIFLALLINALSIAPENIRNLLNLIWLKETIFYSYSFVDINRPVSTITILCFLGVFIGILYAIDSKKTVLLKLLGLLFAAISMSVFILSYLRGPILAIIISLVDIIIIVLLIKKYKIFVMLLFVSMIFIMGGYLFTTNYHNIAMEKWSLKNKNIQQIIDPVRIEQTEKMIKAWLDEPFLGMGVGVSVPSYTRSPEKMGLAYEVQYPIILYRVGLVGFILIIIPLIFIILRLQNDYFKRYSLFENNLGKLYIGVGFSIMSLLISSWFNPYFTTVMTPLFIALFYALDDNIKNHLNCYE